MKLVAVSGGLDSMCLLHMMTDEKIGVIHINHNTRGKENFLEENLVKRYCENNSIPFFKFNFLYDNKGNFHKQAREYRYAKFKEVIISEGFSSVYLAHHLDDQVENILMNPLKIGSKIMGEKENIGGIIIKRPLLNKTKHELYKYAKINDVGYLEDSSNNSEKYYRNRTRKVLKKYTDEEKKRIYLKEKKRTENIKSLIIYYKSMKVITNEMLLRGNEHIYCFLKSRNVNSNISLNKINLILSFLKKSKNGQIFIDSNKKLINSYNNIYILENKKKEEIIYNKKLVKEEEIVSNSLLSYKVKSSGYIRNAKLGDKIKISNGHKKVSRFFIDEKIPKEVRKNWPIIVNDKDEVIYIPKKSEVNIKG